MSPDSSSKLSTLGFELFCETARSKSALRESIEALGADDPEEVGALGRLRMGIYRTLRAT